MAQEGTSSMGSGGGDGWRPRSGKVGPAEEQQPSSTQSSTNNDPRKPLQKKLAFLDVRLRKSVIEEEPETGREGSRTSVRIRIYLVVVALGGFALGAGLTYYGAQKTLTDFLVIGIGSILTGAICLGIATGLTVRDIHKHGWPSRGKPGREELAEEPLEPEEDLPKYFVPPSDTTTQTVYRQRRPSQVELYGTQKTRADLHSAGMRSDGVLTTTGLDLEDGSEPPGSPREVQTPQTPLVTFPRSALDSERVYSRQMSVGGGNQGVFTAPIVINSASKTDSLDSLEKLEKDIMGSGSSVGEKTNAHGEGSQKDNTKC